MEQKRKSSGCPPVRAVERACAILRCFRYEGEVLRLRDVTERTSLSKSTAYRLLRSLQAGGLLQRVGEDSFSSLVHPIRESRPRIALASQTEESSFSRAVTMGVRRAAEQAGVDLICLDNQYSIRAAIRNAQMLVRERVDLVLEFQTYSDASSQVGAIFAASRIPVIAIEIPMPGAIFFGVDNYEAGRLAGAHLGRWAAENWNSRADGILLVGEPIAGPVPNSRLDGLVASLRKCLEDPDSVPVTYLNGKGSLSQAYQAVRKFLRQQPPGRYLVAGINDPSAVGALRAFEEAGRGQDCAVIGFGGVREGFAELRRKNSRFLATVAFFPERYGDRLISLAMDLLGGKKLPPAIHVKHELLTRSNLHLLYPVDIDEIR
jgi:ribose transport system substrate-binding protein